MLVGWAQKLALAAFLPTLVSGCIQAHTYTKTGTVTQDTRMYMQVWVNGKLVCNSGDSQGLGTTDKTEFSAQNGDGKGYGCAPGYSVIFWEHGYKGRLHYWENGNIVWTKYLSQGPVHTNTVECLPCFENSSGEQTCSTCTEFETALSADTCDNVKERGLCDFRDICERPGSGFDPPVPFPFTPKKLMIVGDSISHGADGDWTWRYRLWQWLQDQGYDITFVGPYKGTNGPANIQSAKPRPPLLPGESEPSFPVNSGTYATGVPSAFISQGHAAWWGRQAKQDEGQIEGWVREHQPDYILMLLGFNDLGWWVTGPQGLIYSMTELVDGARRGKPNVKFAIGNVVERLFIGGRQDLVDNTLDYNQKLKGAVDTWNWNLESPVALVDVASVYDCRPGGCPDGYDGLHPGAMGELHIAKAFADVLTNDNAFLMKGKDFKAENAPDRPISTPSGFSMSATDLGLLMSWTKQTNARGYNMRMRIKGQTSWWSDGEVYPNANLAYFTWCLKGQVWEAQVAARGDHNQVSGWSNILSATCNPKTSPGPDAIEVQPSGDNAISFKWAGVTGYSVDRYVAIIWDKDEPGAFIDQRATRGTSITISGLTKGHKYGCWVSTWVKMPDGSLGGGLPAAAREVRVGMGAPPVVTGLSVVNKEPTTITLSWSKSPNAGGYQILYRAVATPQKIEVVGTTRETSYEVGFLFPGTWNYEFCVQSYNGNLQSACTAFIKPPKYPGFKRSVHEPRKQQKPAPLKLTGNNTVPEGFLVDKLTPQMWKKLTTEAVLFEVTPPTNVTLEG